jgi:acetylornithine deacetylase/succinyl-diaminopimelate desuccinylase-like protein
MVAMVSFSETDTDYVRQLSEFVAIPSVSRDSAPETMRQAAAWLADQLRFAKGRIMETEGHPVVLGELAGPSGTPTVLVYGHYDVQPIGSLAEWISPPFELTVDGEVMRGRGATDDKGPVFIVLKVAQAFAAQEGAAPLNVKFIFEGEEEIGSPNFANFVRGHSEELSADLVISADGAMWRPNEPSLSVGSKGLVGMDVEVAGAHEDLHSGRYGGTVANPLHALVQVLASLHTVDGAVAVPGFCDGIPELDPSRREEISRVAFDEADYQRRLGVPDLYGEPGYTTLERLWERPTLEINGVKGGGKYTVIPHDASPGSGSPFAPTLAECPPTQSPRTTRRCGPRPRHSITSTQTSRSCWPRSAEPYRPRCSSRMSSAPRPSSSPSRPPTSGSTLPTSTCASFVSARGCGPGSVFGGCWATALTGSEPAEATVNVRHRPKCPDRQLGMGPTHSPGLGSGSEETASVGPHRQVGVVLGHQIPWSVTEGRLW